MQRRVIVPSEKNHKASWKAAMTWAIVMRKQTGCVSLCGRAVNHCLLMVGVIGAGVGPISPTAALYTITMPTETPLLPASYQRYARLYNRFAFKVTVTFQF